MTTTPETEAAAPPNDGAGIPDPLASAGRALRRQRVFLWIAVAAAVLAVGGMLASLLVKSPAERAAEQSPPPPTVLTAAVQRTVLATTTLVRGTVVADRESTVANRIQPSVDTLAVVTATPKEVGARVTQGSVVAEVSGRPVIALPGRFPSYRTLAAGMTGPDVTQLRAALAALGYRTNDRAGTFGSSTGAAVRALYAARGYSAATADATAADTTTTDAAASARPSARDVIVPLGEIAYVDTLPATVSAVAAPVGTVLAEAGAPILTLRSGGLSVTATLAEGQQTGVVRGLDAEIVDDLRGRSAQGRVASVGPLTAAGTGSGAAQASPSTAAGAAAAGAPSTAGYPLRVAARAGVDAGWLGSAVLVRITTASTGVAVLAVPSSAIATRADGSTSVTVRTEDRGSRDVPVVTGAAAAGLVQVTPERGDGLAEGDMVVVGQQ